jgi:hypothetical protein
MSTTDDIDKKKQENNNETDDTPKENDWKTFGFSCLFGLIIAIITWLISSNIVFFTRLPKEILDNIFPKDPTEPPFEPKADYVQSDKCTNKHNINIPGNGEVNVWEALKDLKIVENNTSAPPSTTPSGSFSSVASNPLAAAAASSIPAAAAALRTTTSSSTPDLTAVGLNSRAANLLGIQPSSDNSSSRSSFSSSGQNGGNMNHVIDYLRSNEPTFRWPYTWMYPFNDCTPDVATSTKSKFYIGNNKIFDKPEFNNSVYNKDGNINNKNTKNNKEVWTNAMKAIGEEIKKMISIQQEQINEVEKNETNEENKNKIKNKMKANMKILKAVQNYFDPSISSGSWWSQFFANAKNWIATSTQYSFITEHRFLQFILNKLKPLYAKQSIETIDDLSLQEPNSYIFGLFGMILNVFIVYFIVHFVMIIGTVVNAWGQISGAKYTGYVDGKLSKQSHFKKGILYTIVFCCMGFINFMYSFGVGIAQYVEVIYKFLMYPILNNFKQWSTNIKTTIGYLPVIYGLFIYMAANASLEPIYGNVMMITLIIYIIKLNKNKNADIKKAKQGL